jgi:hypothetical protein
MVGFFLNALAQLVHLFAFLWSHGSNWLPQKRKMDPRMCQSAQKYCMHRSPRIDRGFDPGFLLPDALGSASLSQA